MAAAVGGDIEIRENKTDPSGIWRTETGKRKMTDSKDKPAISREQVRSILEIARQHDARLKELRLAIESGQPVSVIYRLARMVVGLSEGESAQ